MKPLIDLLLFHKKFFTFLVITFFISFFLLLMSFKNINEKYKINVKLNSFNGEIISSKLNFIKINSENITSIKYFNSINEIIIEVNGNVNESEMVIKNDLIEPILKELKIKYENEITKRNKKIKELDNKNKILNENKNKRINKLNDNSKFHKELINKNYIKIEDLEKKFELFTQGKKEKINKNEIAICSISFLLENLEYIFSDIFSDYIKLCNKIDTESFTYKIIKNKFNKIIKMQEEKINQDKINLEKIMVEKEKIKEDYDYYSDKRNDEKNVLTKEITEINKKYAQNVKEIMDNKGNYKVIDYSLLKSFLISIMISIIILIFFDIKIRKKST